MTQENVVQIDFDKIETDESTATIIGENIIAEHQQLLLPDIQALLKHHQKQCMNYTDQRLMKVLEDIKKNSVIIDEHTAQLGEHDKMLQEHAQLIQSLQKTQSALPVTPDAVPAQQNLADVVTAIFQNAKQNTVSASPQEKQGTNVLDSTLGTIGGVAHGIVDTAAFICESIIDLATLGKARRGRV